MKKPVAHTIETIACYDVANVDQVFSPYVTRNAKINHIFDNVILYNVIVAKVENEQMQKFSKLGLKIVSIAPYPDFSVWIGFKRIVKTGDLA